MNWPDTPDEEVLVFDHFSWGGGEWPGTYFLILVDLKWTDTG